MKINIMTLFPEMFAPLKESMIGRAVDNGIMEINIINIRDYTKNKHNRVDDTPYGGGAGMLMQCQPIWDAYTENRFSGDVLYMSPRGEMLSGSMAEDISHKEEITILCGHYEGVDQRVLDKLGAKEVSIGDYILTGGELPAMVLIDTVARFIDGVLASEESAMEESVYLGLLEYPHYSKPREWEGMEVPETLLSGNHGMIDLWRFEEALKLTKERRPDMFEDFLKSERTFSKQEKKIIEKYR
ncbi:MAG: tRNA (guanosine(37)-N1)-methyltransferase TrmD [Clostridiales bacterium]|jgi:tRNA (guanine37-N1)-methyltransferase|nr:tRNA (guanosine(37)-N1)-methyltransferase TrmD [Clostridiales bacterium]